MHKTLEIRVTGKVQGVWYRQSTRDKALEFGLTGWVRNEPDGSVLILASGEPADLERLADWCRTGPPRARVSGITIQETAEEKFSSFIVVR